MISSWTFSIATTTTTEVANILTQRKTMQKVSTKWPLTCYLWLSRQHLRFWRSRLVKALRSILSRLTGKQHKWGQRNLILPPCLNSVLLVFFLASQIIETVVYRRLSKYLDSANILPAFQSGFRKGRGTATTLLDVVNNILAALEVGKSTFLVLLDFSKTFDSLSIPLLLSKVVVLWFWLKRYDSLIAIFCLLLVIFISYSEIVELRMTNGASVYSSPRPVSKSVPQRAFLGPLLFILYRAHIVTSVRSYNYRICISRQFSAVHIE